MRNDIYSKPISIRDQLWFANWFRPLLLALYELGAWSAAIAASIVGPPWAREHTFYLCGLATVRMVFEIFKQQRAINRADKSLAKLDAELDLAELEDDL